MNKNLPSLLILFLFFVLSILAMLLIYQQARRFFLSRFSQDKTKKERGEGGLLVNTFQGVIHELKQKERVLEQTKEEAQAYAKTMENYNQNILRSVTSGVITFNCDGNVTTVNPAAEAILGFKREAVLGKSCEGAFGANNSFSPFVQETLDQKKEVLREESEGVRSDGQKVWLGLTTSALRNQKGIIIGAIIVFTDLTEMKVLQDQVDLKKRLALLGEMSAFIAHEFRNYMGTIWGFASMISKELKTNAGAQAMTAGIIRELATMEQLIADLLSYGKKPVLTLQQTAIVPLIEEAMANFGAVLFNTEFEACEAAVDPVLLRQALLNLIQNGLEAMESKNNHGKKITITAHYLGNRFVEIKISDTGRGIPSDQIDKIFFPFFTTKEKGNGLGLALVHKIILSHNGTISVESKEHQGTTFTITLPAQRP
ncbi:MAG: PAS domain-containing protein [Nitrospirae bacterium]|nr:PAS domain-containing protein [Candidatus Troglogloeales bacterium]